MSRFGHGKVILLGEHAVVYGHPALAAGLARGVCAVACPADADRLRIRPWNIDVTPDRESDSPLGRAFFAALAARTTVNRPALQVEADIDIPTGAGLGGSAALGVAVLRATSEALNETLSTEALTQQSLRWEQEFHGNPSGVDNAMAVSGGIAHYTKAAGLTQVNVPSALHVVVADTGQPCSTRDTVAAVAAQRSSAPDATDAIFEQISALVTIGEKALRTGEYERLGRAMTANHQLLRQLHLSTPRLEELCDSAATAGALGAKLTGGGGGGCIVALAANAVSAERIATALGTSAFATEIRP